MTEPDLFAYGYNNYPNVPGWKGRETSRQAAESVKPKAPLVRERIINLMTPALAVTADEAADLLQLPILTVRPRFSELAADNKLVDTGRRRKNASGKSAIVWQLAA